jgi:hypothetical protein
MVSKLRFNAAAGTASMKEALALTHALEMHVLPKVRTQTERQALADEISRIADQVRQGMPDAGMGGVSPHPAAINLPELTGMSSKLLRPSGIGLGPLTVIFDHWPPKTTGNKVCKTCKRPL